MKLLSISLAALLLIDQASSHKLDQRHRLQQKSHLRTHGIFDKMIELATAEDKVAEERHEATMRKQ